MPRKASKKKNKQYRKETIPKALREQTWLQTFGKCYVTKTKKDYCTTVYKICAAGAKKVESNDK